MKDNLLGAQRVADKRRCNDGGSKHVVGGQDEVEVGAVDEGGDEFSRR
jgi:hypothetical protein